MSKIGTVASVSRTVKVVQVTRDENGELQLAFGQLPFGTFVVMQRENNKNLFAGEDVEITLSVRRTNY